MFDINEMNVVAHKAAHAAYSLMNMKCGYNMCVHRRG